MTDLQHGETQDGETQDEEDRVFDLNGKTAVVTGSSSGIGRQIAMRLAKAGADCLIHARQNVAAAEEVASAVRRQGRQAHVVLADLSDPEQRDSLIAKACAWRPQIDIWINNAGADVLTGEAATWPFDRKLQHLWEVDVVSTVRLAREIGMQMKSRGSGTILNMGWDQAATGMAGDSGEMFATVKGAVMAFSKSLAHSLAPEVRVNCLAPGWIRTAWGQQANDYWHDRAATESLLGRWGTPEDVAGVAHFLVSPAAAFITGQVIAVNGGLRGQGTEEACGE